MTVRFSFFQSAARALGLAGESFDDTLRDVLARDISADSPRQRFADVSDDFWFWALTEGCRTHEELHALLPAMPPEEIQLRFTGAAGDVTLREAFSFYLLVRDLMRAHLRRPLESALDYGCGWGRIIRFFLRDVEPANLAGIDCFPQMIELCQATNRWARFTQVDPFPPTMYADESFDLIYAFSVFSHLSEHAHFEWLKEFKRLLRPGGLLIVTTRAREFILMCADMRAQQEQRFWTHGPAASFRDTEDALARYDRGEFLYEPIGGGDVLDPSFFGETCIPLGYVRTHWTRLFELVDYIDDRQVCVQNVIAVRKT